jgi:hypothetical protein
VSIDWIPKSEYIYDFVTPEYRRKIRLGMIINNPCTYTSEKRTESEGSYHVKYNYGSPPIEYTDTGLLTSWQMDALNVGFLDLLTDTSEREAKLQALTNIDSTPYQFGEDLLELRETIRFLRSPLKPLLNLSIAVQRSLRKERLARKLKNLTLEGSNTYLAYRFALSPLIRSAADAVDAFASGTRVPPVRRTARGFNDDTKSSGDQVDMTSIGRIFDRTTTVVDQRRAAILYEVSNPIHDMTFNLGLRAKDIPETLWAVMPYSFMVDRLVDISGFTRAVTNLLDPAVTILAASTTHRKEAQKTCSVRRVSYSNYTFTTLGVGYRTDTSFTYDRKVWHPTFKDAVPEITPGNVVDGALKIADILALISANLR